MTLTNATESQLKKPKPWYETELTLFKNSVLPTQANYVKLRINYFS